MKKANQPRAPRILNESATKALLKTRAAAATIAAEAIEWINHRALAAVEDCAKNGRRYPSGRLSCPDSAGTPGNMAPGPVIIQTPAAAAAESGNPPDRVCQRAKEWRALPPDAKAAHLEAVWNSFPIEKRIEILQQLAILTLPLPWKQPMPIGRGQRAPAWLKEYWRTPPLNRFARRAAKYC